ncbi:hypothetical protein [Cupriavidus sp. UYPR2.512]|uniref:hypothetical protein n=1 Tax=Cupriavidus sp. UYPR2.512 TaxID=1080187 RepID=UPI0003825590|nr:hypothetical protein [Cupriavidus sp. UYPR2.512]UIF89424.1 hypothetical protein KAF44_29585 [Cupriavidus necator]
MKQKFRRLAGRTKTSFAYLFGWFLGALNSVAIGVIDVGASVSTALAIWLGLATLSTLCTAPAFGRCVSPLERAAWVFVPLSLPPVAMIYPLPPAAAAGWWAPSTGVLGVLCMIVFAAAVLESVKRATWQPIAVPVICIAMLNLHAALLPPAPSRVKAVSLPVDKAPADIADSIRAALRYAPVVREAAERSQASGDPTPIIMLPENVLGPVSPGQVGALQLTPPTRLIAGGSAIVPWAAHMQKGVWVLPDRAFYPAIQPIPFIEEGLKPHWSAIGRTAPIGAERYSLLVCFEAITSLPLYHLHFGTPILLLGNGWWDRSGIMDIEDSLGHAWARLFNNPIGISRGYPLPGKAP